MAGNVHHAHRVRVVGDLKFDHGVIQLAQFQLSAEHIAGSLASIRAGDGFNHALFGGSMCVGFDLFAHVLAGGVDRGINQIADDLLNIAANITNFGELRGFNLDKRRFGQTRQAAADFGFTNTSGPDHQDVFGINLITQIIA